MKAVEALDNYDSKRHAGVIQFFRQNYIKTGLFDKSLSGMIDRLQNARGDSDYNITVRFSSEDANAYLKEATIIVKAIEEYLQVKYTETADIWSLLQRFISYESSTAARVGGDCVYSRVSDNYTSGFR